MIVTNILCRRGVLAAVATVLVAGSTPALARTEADFFSRVFGERSKPAKVRQEAPLQLAALGGQRGVASYYWQSQKTANGERFNPESLTAAHRSLPFGTVVRVTNQRNGKKVYVRINDRGPFIGGRVIDLSRAAAREIGMIESGLAPVAVEVVR